MWLICVAGCQSRDTGICQSNIGGRVTLHHISDSSHVLCHILGADTISRWPLPYPVYRTDHGDLTGNGEHEIAVGVIKSCRHWKQVGNRLFIFKLYNGELIRPLWLGSRTGYKLLDFRIERDSTPARIITTEYSEADSATLRLQYRIKGFGISFERYIN